MVGFYEDPEKITFDRAAELVKRYARKRGDQVTRVTCKDVAREFDVEDSHHNLIRINNELDELFEVTRPSGSKAIQYELDTDAAGIGSSSSEEVE